jgi:hypothetical protein
MSSGMKLCLHFVCVHVVGKLAIPVGVSCFENICSKCHIPSLINRYGGFYNYGCKSMVIPKSQA